MMLYNGEGDGCSFEDIEELTLGYIYPSVYSGLNRFKGKNAFISMREKDKKKYAES